MKNQVMPGKRKILNLITGPKGVPDPDMDWTTDRRLWHQQQTTQLTYWGLNTDRIWETLVGDGHKRSPFVESREENPELFKSLRSNEL
jgi:hypothetical protein